MDTLPRTRSAYALWLVKKAGLHTQLQHAHGAAAIRKWEHDVKTAWRSVQLAFAADMEGTFDAENCLEAQEDDIRERLGLPYLPRWS